MAYENRDYTHLSEEEKQKIELIAQAIRNKAYGIDVRESIALAIEWVNREYKLTIENNILTLKEFENAKSKVSTLELDMDKFIKRYSEQIAGNTSLDEMIDARIDATGVSHTTLKDRLDKEQQEVSTQLAQITNIIKDKTYSDLLLKMVKGESVNIVCYGDSITFGYIPNDGTQTTNPYPQTLQSTLREYYKNNNINVINEGISGATSTDLATSGNINNVTANNPDLVVLMVGINDNNAIMDVHLYQENVYEIIKKVNPIPVLLLTPTPYIRNWNGTEYETKDRAITYVKAVKEVALKTNTMYFDTHKLVKQDVEFLNKNYRFIPDNLHFTDEYYQRFSDFVFLSLCNDDIITQEFKFIDTNDSLWNITNTNIIGNTISPKLRTFIIQAGGKVELWLFVNKPAVKVSGYFTLGTRSGAPSDTTHVEVDGVIVDSPISTDFYNTLGRTVWNTKIEIGTLTYGLHKLAFKNTSVDKTLYLSGVQVENTKLGDRRIEENAGNYSAEAYKTTFDGQYKIANNSANVMIKKIHESTADRLKISFSPNGMGLGFGFGSAEYTRNDVNCKYPVLLVKSISNGSINATALTYTNSNDYLGYQEHLINASTVTFNQNVENTLEIAKRGLDYDIFINDALVYTLSNVVVGDLDVYLILTKDATNMNVSKIQEYLE